MRQYQSMYPSLTVDVEDQLKKLKVDSNDKLVINGRLNLVKKDNKIRFLMMLCRNTLRDCGRW